MLDHLHFGTKVLSAYLKPEERKRIVEDFNDPQSKLKILIVMYAVSSQGVNLDRCCSLVLVAAPVTPLANSSTTNLLEEVYGGWQASQRVRKDCPRPLPSREQGLMHSDPCRATLICVRLVLAVT